MKQPVVLALFLAISAASGRGSVLYILDEDFSGVGSNPAGSTVSWEFQVPAVLTTHTIIPSSDLMGLSLGSALSGCTVQDVQIPQTPGPAGYAATVETAFASACGALGLTGTGGKFLVDPASLGIYDIYGGVNNVQLGTLDIADLLKLQGGPSSSPVALNVPLVAAINGTIGSFGTEDYYSFVWLGGAFSATATIGGTPNAGASYLFSEGTDSACSNGGIATLSGGDSFSGTISIPNLPRGNYCIGVDANNASDPPFTLTFNTPVEGAPEPASLILIAVGLAVVTMKRRLSSASGSTS